MSNNKETASNSFEAPGPGAWSIDRGHVPRPFSRLQAEIHPENLAKGFRDCARRYGLLLDTLDYQFVNGIAYSMVVPAPEAELPARFAAAAEVFDRKIWREDLAQWDNVVKPAAIKTHQELQAIEPDALSDEELLKLIERCHSHLGRMVQQHHRFNAAALVPVGDFMAHVAAWTGQPLNEFLALMRGAAPESAGSFPELDNLVGAIRNDSAAEEVLGSDAPDADILARLRQMPGAVGVAAKSYLDIVACRLLDSLDTGEPAAIEVPEVLVAGIKHAVEDGAPKASVVPDEEVARLRGKIPAEHHAMFDELLGEARLVSRLRDERGLYSDVWAGGILRRALLTAGRRLVAKGRIEEAAHLVEAGYQEILSIIGGASTPSARELAERANYRKTFRSDQAPSVLGDPPSAPPPLDGLPPAVGRLMQAIGTAIGSLDENPQTAASDTTVVRGTGASPGTYTGTARFIDGPAEFGRLQNGDVLVTATTTESFNVALPLLGAIVTNAGGLLSHAAIVSREYGIPSVVGTRDATVRIPDGTRVTVDGTTGEVRFDAP
jgi:phosphohistidine swiveling domain-containing protein